MITVTGRFDRETLLWVLYVSHLKIIVRIFASHKRLARALRSLKRSCKDCGHIPPKSLAAVKPEGSTGYLDRYHAQLQALESLNNAGLVGLRGRETPPVQKSLPIG